MPVQFNVTVTVLSVMTSAAKHAVSKIPPICNALLLINATKTRDHTQFFLSYHMHFKGDYSDLGPDYLLPDPYVFYS